ncbi:MAG: glutamine synthetase type III, partial [Flavobacteriales bacterium]|nr:glutamine synthetase type III [Flavobacteriales bacterium]
DRNRTSPFAFTGNKFEFRAVGSTANCAHAMTVLNTIVAKQLEEFKISVDKRIAGGDKKDEAILKELQVLIKQSKSIRFEGNGYSDEWVVEAKKRGLSNLINTPQALEVWERKEVVKLFEEMNVLHPLEVEARVEVDYENYILKRQIEARISADLAQNHIIPAAITYQNRLIENARGLVDVLGATAGKKAATVQIELITSISEHLSIVKQTADELLAERRKIDAMESAKDKAKEYAEVVMPLMNKIRTHADELEMLVDDEIWPMPKLREILFTR